MLVFLAMPYSQLCDEKYVMKDKYITFFCKLTAKIRSMNHRCFLAAERENYGKEYSSDEESAQIDYDTIRSCDLLCVIPGNPISGGVHVELGWASACKKDINIFLNKNSSYSPMVTGLKCLSNVNYYYYDEDFSNELIELICSSLKEKDEN